MFIYVLHIWHNYVGSKSKWLPEKASVYRTLPFLRAPFLIKLLNFKALFYVLMLLKDFFLPVSSSLPYFCRI